MISILHKFFDKDIMLHSNQDPLNEVLGFWIQDL